MIIIIVIIIIIVVPSLVYCVYTRRTSLVREQHIQGRTGTFFWGGIMALKGPVGGGQALNGWQFPKL